MKASFHSCRWAKCPRRLLDFTSRGGSSFPCSPTLRWEEWPQVLRHSETWSSRALTGFAGPRVVQATVKKPLPDGFQTSEFLLEHGFIDRIVPRPELRTEIARIIDYCGT